MPGQTGAPTVPGDVPPESEQPASTPGESPPTGTPPTADEQPSEPDSAQPCDKCAPSCPCCIDNSPRVPLEVEQLVWYRLLREADVITNREYEAVKTRILKL